MTAPTREPTNAAPSGRSASARATSIEWSAWLAPGVVVLAFFGLWQVAATSGWINSTLFPPPSDIWRALSRMHTRDPDESILLHHVWVTIQRLFWATLLGAALGAFIGAAMGLSRFVYRALDPLITLIMPIPGIALAPLFIVWLGFGTATIVCVGAIAAFFPIAYNTAAGVRTVDQQLVRASRTMGAGRLQTIMNVHLPWSLAFLLLGLKLGFARGWRTVVAVELIASTNWGLGYMIWDAAEYLQSATVYGGIILMIVVYFLIERLFLGVLEHRTINRWGMLNDE